MIFVHDKGRMANNMLQYGHVYAWGREHGRQTVSIRFAYKYPWFQICHTPYHNFPTYVFAKYAAKWGLIPTVHFDDEEADYRQEEQLMLDRKMVLVDGWYARWYDLFLKYKQEIIGLFAFNQSVVDAVERCLAADQNAPNRQDQNAPSFQDGNVSCRLGVHIRRGDYAHWYDGKFLFSDEVFVNLIRQFVKLHPGTTVYICGNDPSLDQQFYIDRLQGTPVRFPQGNAAEDLCLLSKCDYLIGPPSTYSLVAAMYQDRPLYWIMDADALLTEQSFGHFDDLFRHIL